MRLAGKLILLFLVGVLLIVGVFSYLSMAQIRQSARTGHELWAQDIVATMQSTAPTATRFEDAVQATVRGIEHVDMRWIKVTRGSWDQHDHVPGELVVRQRRVTTVMTTDSSGRDVFHTYVPVMSGNEVVGAVEVSGNPNVTAANESVRRSIMTSLAALLSVTLLSCTVILVGGIHMVAEPLDRLIDKVRRVGRGDLSSPVSITSNDELGKLGTALNDMCEQLIEQRERIETETASRIAAVRQLRHADRLGTVGRLAAGVAHEMGTPLNVVSGRAELIAGGRLNDVEVRRSAEIIKGEADRITKIVRELLDFARRGTPSRSSEDLVELLRQTAAMLESMAGKQSVQFDLKRLPEIAVAEIDSSQMRQVMTNLAVNAIQSMPDGGTVRFEVDQVTAYPPVDETDATEEDVSEQTECWRIDVSDTGTGIAPEHLENLFEPFYTTKDVGEGTGLGLSIAYGIVRDHGGWLNVDSTPGRGSRFSVFLPRLNQDGKDNPGDAR